MIRTKRAEQAKQISGINITPFTDVCLVLLIIFMITAPAILKDESGIKIPLPKASQNAALPAAPINLYIQQGPKISVDNTPVTFETLGAELRKYQPGPDGKLIMVVKADEHVPYNLVIRAIDIAGQSGVSDTMLATRTAQ